MTSTTYIPGKDAALEHSITHLKTAIESLGFDIEEARWLNPAPYIWSVHIRDRDCPQVFSNGKGASRDAALASAYGELIERLSTRYLWADFYLSPMVDRVGMVHQRDELWLAPEAAPLPDTLLDERMRALYDPEGQLTLDMMRDMNGGDTGFGVCALPYQRLSDGEIVMVPVNMIANLFVSNGMSAGNTREEALVQGLSEIFERAIKQRILKEAIALPEVPSHVMARYPQIANGLQALTDAGYPVRALDASLGGRYPVMCVVLQNPHDGGVYASFGAHPRFEVALERALTELLQGRALDELEGFPAPTVDLELVEDAHNMELHFIDSSGYVSWALLSDTPDLPFADWDDSRDNTATCQALITLLEEEGHDVYLAEYTALGAYACRILVPGFSDIYPADELRWNNNNQALPHRLTLMTLPDASEAALDALLEALDTYAVNDQLRVLEWMGIVGDKGTPWAELRIGELKLWLQLALGDVDAATEQAAMVLASGSLSPDTLKRVRAVRDILELNTCDADIDDYRRALVGYYGESMLDEAIQLVDGEYRFPGLTPLNLELPTEAHGRLLEAYEKVLAAQNR